MVAVMIADRGNRVVQLLSEPRRPRQRRHTKCRGAPSRQMCEQSVAEEAARGDAAARSHASTASAQVSSLQASRRCTFGMILMTGSSNNETPCALRYRPMAMIGKYNR